MYIKGGIEMSMSEWAKREVEEACKLERVNDPENESDYGVACYRSALKAYESLTGDNHSGCSVGITQNILNRLIEGKPLTPIEDVSFLWNYISDINDLDKGVGGKYYQNKRMSSLFKYAYSNGTVKYRDINNNRCINIHDHNNVCHSGLVQKIIDELFPITMPYCPSSSYDVYCDDFLFDPNEGGDFDTVGIFYVMKDEIKIDINRFFKEGAKDWIEIDKAEYEKRKPDEKHSTRDEYTLYIEQHKTNVKDGFNWIGKNLPELLEPGYHLGYANVIDHDASKTNTEEYDAYNAYFYGGNKSYTVLKEFDIAWLKHIHNNPHHWQYWVLISDESEEGVKVLDMPYNYIIEMICDWWSFSWKTGDLYSIFDWYAEHKNIRLSPKTLMTVEDILSKIRSKLIELNVED